jgi:hypothetical protein
MGATQASPLQSTPQTPEETIMTTSAPRPSKPARIAGWILSVLTVLLLFFSASMKFAKPPGVAEGFAHIGWTMNLVFALGILEVSVAVIYLIPRTACLGAILVTGYLGGATATHVRVGDAFIGPVIIGMVVWLGLYLRDPRVRALIPLRRRSD